MTKLITSLRKFYVHLHGLVTLLQKYVSLKSYIWRKAYWQKIEEDLEHLTDEIKKIQRSKPIQTMDNIQRQFTTEHG